MSLVMICVILVAWVVLSVLSLFVIEISWMLFLWCMVEKPVWLWLVIILASAIQTLFLVCICVWFRKLVVSLVLGNCMWIVADRLLLGKVAVLILPSVLRSMWPKVLMFNLSACFCGVSCSKSSFLLQVSESSSVEILLNCKSSVFSVLAVVLSVLLFVLNSWISRLFALGFDFQLWKLTVLVIGCWTIAFCKVEIKALLLQGWLLVLISLMVIVFS